MKIAVAKEIDPSEPRVAASPDTVKKFKAIGADIVVEPGAGIKSGLPDSEFTAAGATVSADALEGADIIIKVKRPEASELSRYKRGALVIAIMDPYGNEAALKTIADAGVAAFAMELMPRITRAQSMDALSAMSTVSGYKAVLLAASRLQKFFPLLMTAAGTLTPARVFIIGAGVAGLQAIGTARRLGAVVEAYDTRPVVKEQVESLGGKFVELRLETKDAEAKTGYAKAQSEEFYRQQREVMARSVAAADVVISTALVPGQRAPVLITKEMVEDMRPGSVIVDLAAEQGGNCAVTEPGREVLWHGVRILGPVNLPSTVAFHASQMYARTVANYLTHLLKEGRIQLDLSDELTRGPLVTHEGAIVHETVKATIAAAAKAGPSA